MRGVSYVWVLLVGVIIGGCGQSPTEGARGTHDERSWALECERDEPRLLSLALYPIACTDDAGCAEVAGAHCKRSESICGYQCINDTDCGAGAVCGCDGRCVAGEPDEEEDDAACPRVRALLESPELAQRTCLRDESCPYGSYCEPTGRTCAVECLEDRQCAAGHSCDCTGRCVPQDDEGPRAAAQRPFRLELSVSAIEVEPASWSGTDVDVILIATTEAAANAASQPTVRLAAPAGIGFGQPTPVKTISLTDWTFEPDVEGQWRAVQTVTVVPTDDGGAGATAWSIRVTAGREVAAAREVAKGLGHVQDGLQALVVHATAAAVAPPPTWSDGTYRGFLTPVGAQLSIEESAEGVLTERMPITARVQGTSVTIGDSLHAISQAGVLRFDHASSSGQIFPWWVAANAASHGSAPVPILQRGPGHYAAELRAGRPPVFVAERNAFVGSLRILLPTTPATEREYEYELVIDASVAVPAPDAWDQLVAKTAVVANWQKHADARAWVAGSTDLELDFDAVPDTGSKRGERLLCYDGNSPYWLDGNGGSIELRSAYHWNAFAISGELRCSPMQTPAAVPLTVLRDAVAAGLRQAPTDLTSLLSACLDELAEAPPQAMLNQLHGNGVDRNAARQWFGRTASCIDLRRFYPALEALGRGRLRRTSFDPSGIAPSSMRAHRLFQHLLGQWVAVHSFVATQAAEVRGTPDTVRQAATGLPLPTEAALDSKTILQRLLASWDLLLDGELQSRLLELPRRALRDPDHRFETPTGYWSLDRRDVVGTRAIDLVGDNHMDLPLGYRRPADRPDGIVASILGRATVPLDHRIVRGAFTIAWWLEVPTAFGDILDIGEASDATRSALRLQMTSASTGAADDARIILVRNGQREVISPNLKSKGIAVGDLVHVVLQVDVISRHVTVLINGQIVIDWQMRAAMTVPAAPQLRLRTGTFIDDIAFYTDRVPAQRIAARGRSRGDGTHPALTSIHQCHSSESCAEVTTEHDRDHAAGLPVELVEGLQVQLDAVSHYLEDAAFDGYGQCYAGQPSSLLDEAEALVGEALRKATAVEVLAETLTDRAVAVGCEQDAECQVYEPAATCSAASICVLGDAPVELELPWLARYREALAAYRATRARVVGEAVALRDCDNPLGIADHVVPLFFGDVSGDNSRYFASSDYLINTFARPAVTAVEDGLQAVRSSWVQQLQSSLGEERELEGVIARYAEPIIGLCGLTGVAAEDVLDRFVSERGGTLSAFDCFRKDEPRCFGSGAQADCFSGEMGDAAFAIRQAQHDLEVAQRRASDATAQWQAQDEYCAQEQGKREDQNAAYLAHQRRMNSLGSTLALTNMMSSYMSGIASVASGGGPIGLISGASNAAGAYLQEQMASAEREFATALAIEANDAEVRACRHQANQLAIPIQTMSRDAFGYVLAAERAGLRLRILQEQLQVLLLEGRAAYARAAGRNTAELTNQFWIDEDVMSFRRNFAWAKRVTYLALLAVEYELQQSLELRGSLAAARTAAELRVALNTLIAAQASRSINGYRPQTNSMVLSLRNDIWGMSDRVTRTAEGAPLPGERQLSAEKRFSDWITSPDFAVYDRQGRYLGQGIPFNLHPTHMMELVCGERLWRMNATLQGDSLSASAPNAPIVVLKRDAFGSQWCSEPPDGSAMQTGTISSSAELFRNSGGADQSRSDSGYVRRCCSRTSTSFARTSIATAT